ncbi:MAG: hypothetical protein HMLKMBBP_03101 [Planctomycetes bacterium]|nr:hypothetical protein [Planctomycetota bacterium]
MHAPERPLVLVDADDTLWENNRAFTEAIELWRAWMEVRGIPRDDAVRALEAAEDRNIPRTGYGAAPFAASVADAYAALRPVASDAERAEHADLVLRIEMHVRTHPIELLPGVEDGLAALAERARVVILTKGREDEQTAKVARSGLARHVEATIVVAEKRPDVYAAACARFAADPPRSWMIGNSPKSDINPARRAGLRTILVPHAAPWHRELEALCDTGFETEVVATFADVPRVLARYFDDDISAPS